MIDNRRVDIISGYFLLAGLEALAAFLLLLPGSVNASGQFLAYSASRLILMAVFLIAFIGAMIMAWLFLRRTVISGRIMDNINSSRPGIPRWLWVSGVATALLFTVLLMPLYRFGAWSAYAARVVPLAWWIALVCAQTFLLLLFWRGGAEKETRRGITPRLLLFSGIAFLVLTLTLIWIALTGVGVVARGSSWYPVGVPLLPGQVWAMGWLTVVFGAALTLWRRSRLDRPPRRWKWNADVFIFWGIWGVTALLWTTAILPRNFFFPGPYPPNNVIYPYADSATWDMGGQYALIGQGFDNGDPFQDHAGLMGLLAFLHLLVGDNYAVMSAALAGLLAVFPALMYWLGSIIHSRWAGFFIAGLTVFHELNAFAASNMIDLSHARFLLTEYPTRVGLAALALLLFYWFRAPRRNIAYALPVGGLLAFLILMRFNMLAFPLAVVVGALLFFKRDLKGWVRASSLLVVSTLLVLGPWMWRSWTLSGTPFFFAEKTQMLFNEKFRFRPPVTPTPPSSLDFDPANESSPEMQLIRAKTPNSARPERSLAFPPTKGNSQVVQLIVGHFMHNLTTSALILPTSLAFDDVRHTIYEVHPYWEKKGAVWQGDLTLPEAILVILNLGLIAIGLGASWDRWKLAGLIPLGICLAYALSLAVARTSGGRYIVPMDWGIVFYWGLGITQAALWGAAYFGVKIQKQDLPASHQGGFSYKRGWLALAPFLLFVVAMTAMDRAVPQKYSALTKMEIFDLLKQNGALQQANISEKALSAFLKKRNSRAYLGKALYPRFYGMGQGESSGGVDAYEPEEYPRLAFTLIGAFDKKDIVLASMIQDPSKLRNTYFPNASDIVVVGCMRAPRSPKTKSMIDALFVVILDEKPLVYMRNPAAPLICPLPAPVCVNNASCQQAR
ncbi:MAG: hypothetical protein PGMFKBFP_01495 [Anaerolineales bacterium]|nr:hypothetical protein [Anaerolineales bacterium]